MVLCHQNFDQAKTQQPDLWHFDKPSSDGRCGVYVFKEKTTKSVRPAQTRYWEYPDRNGSRLVRVVRVDDGFGNKKVRQQHWDKNIKDWVSGWGDVVRASIPIYRRAEVLEAIAKRQPIHIVEGEPCADLLWKLGLAATTNIGGAEKFTLTDSMDLQGAELIVIVPDRDKKGIKHAQKVAEHFPEALWLYPFPESKVWENLPDDHGLDIADWIEHNKLTAESIKAAIGEKKTFNASPQEVTKVLRHPKFEAPNLSDLAVKIDELLDSDLRRSQLQIKISELAQTYRLTPAEVQKIYRTREQELEQELEQEDTAAEVARLLSAQKSGLELSQILPAQLTAPIETLAARLNLKAECYLIALLTQVSSLFKVGSEVLLRRDTDYRCTPNYFGVTVSESSQKKSPVLKAIIDRPMQSLREKARKEYDKAVAQYEEEYRQWKAAKGENKGLPPKEPRQRLYSFSKSTGEGILYQVAAHPDQALMYRCDELAGLFKSANQYRGGKGSDEEDLLEFWNGTGSTVLRASGTKADLDGLLLSIFGTIQPDVLAALLKDCSDSNGKFARFDFVFQPLAASKLPEEDNGSFDLTPMLSSLYTKIDALPALKMELAPEAKRLFTAFYNATDERRVAEPKQGMRAMIGKMPEKVGKMTAIIHTLTCVFNGVEVSLQIPKSVVEAAIKFVKFSSDQIASLYAEFSDRQALAPSLAKIVLLAERNGGVTSVREVSKSFTSKLRPNNQQIREWFAELAAMDYGEVTSKGRVISFILRPQPPTPPLASNPCTQTVCSAPNSLDSSPPIPPLKITNGGEWGRNGGEVAPNIKPLLDKALDTNGGAGGEKKRPSENTQPLMMSCTTEVSPEDAAKFRDIALVWWSEYYPAQLQNLLTQMYGWNAPGTKYDVAVIAGWLENQDKLIRDRITELVNQKKASLDR
jgi:CRISPR-associated protein Cmr3